MKTIQVIVSLLLVATASAFYEHDHVKKEMVENLRSQLGDLKTGTIYGNLLNKQHGADDRLYKADDTLNAMQRSQARSSHHGIRQLLDLTRERREDKYEDWDEDDEDDEDDGEF